MAGNVVSSFWFLSGIGNAIFLITVSEHWFQRVIGVLGIPTAILFAVPFLSTAKKHWQNRVKVGEKLAELDAPIPARPWLPTVVAAALSATGAVIAALVTAALTD